MCVFCSHIVDEHTEDTLPLLRILVQHICHQVDYWGFILLILFYLFIFLSKNIEVTWVCVCVFQMVEKAEYRASGAQAVGKLVTKMPCEHYATFVKWLYNYSLNTRVCVHYLKKMHTFSVF